MSDEQLPETDDPFELLGLDRETDARGAKRAYVRLIKRFKPDRAPEEFKRIYQAYEQVKRQLAERALFGDQDAASSPVSADDAGAPEDSDSDPSAAPPGPREATPTSSAWDLDADDADLAVDWSWEISFRASSVDSLAAVQKLLRLIQADEPNPLLYYLSQPELVSRVAQSPLVEGAAVMAYASLSMTHPDEVAAAARQLPGSRELDHCYIVLDDMLALAEDWRDTNKRMICPAQLSRLLRLARAVPEAQRQSYANELLRAFDEDRASYDRFFHMMGRQSYELFEHLHLSLDNVGDLKRVPVDDFPRETRQVIAAGVRDAARTLHGRLDRQLLIAGGALAAVACIVLAFRDLGAGGGGAIGVIILTAILLTTLRDHFYRSGPSKKLADLARRTGVGPEPLAKWVRENPRTGGRLRRYTDWIEADATVRAAAIIHAAHQDPGELADRIGLALYAPPPLNEDERIARMTADELEEHLAEQRTRQKTNAKRDAVVVAVVFAGVAALITLLWLVV